MALKVADQVSNPAPDAFEKTAEHNARGRRTAQSGQHNQRRYEYGARRGRRHATKHGISYTYEERELPGHLRRSDLNEIDNWYSAHFASK